MQIILSKYGLKNATRDATYYIFHGLIEQPSYFEGHAAFSIKIFKNLVFKNCFIEYFDEPFFRFFH